jgi:outer membrane protein TolC
MRITVSFGLESLLPFSQAAVSAERAAKEAAALRLDRQSAIESAEREYRSLVRSVRNARTALESQRLNVSLNEEVVQLTEEAYEAGQSDFLSLQEAQVDLAEARLALLNEAYNLKTNLIELEYASGQPSIE